MVNRLITFLTIFLLLATQVYAYSYSIRVKDTDTNHKTWFTHEAKAGYEIHDALIITNKSTERFEFNIKATDASVDEDSEAFHSNNNEPLSVGKWVNLSKNSLFIDPLSSEEVEFVINIPKDTTPGKYYGSIMVSPVTEGNDSGSSINTRIGARIYLTVSESGQVLANFSFKWIYVVYGVVLLLILELLYSIIKNHDQKDCCNN